MYVVIRAPFIQKWALQLKGSMEEAYLPISVVIFQVARNPLKLGMPTLFVLKNARVFFSSRQKKYGQNGATPPPPPLPPNNVQLPSLRTETLYMCVSVLFPQLEGEGGLS